VRITKLRTTLSGSQVGMRGLAFFLQVLYLPTFFVQKNKFTLVLIFEFPEFVKNSNLSGYLKNVST